MAIAKTGVSTLNCQLMYTTSSIASGNETKLSTYTNKLKDLQSIPALGGKKDSIEITTLADPAHTYMAGLENYGDSLDFVFLKRPIDLATTSPEADQFDTLSNLTGDVHWAVVIADKTSSGVATTGATIAYFDGTCSVGLDAAGVNAALTYTLSVKPGTKITFAKVTA